VGVGVSVGVVVGIGVRLGVGVGVEVSVGGGVSVGVFVGVGEGGNVFVGVGVGVAVFRPGVTVEGVGLTVGRTTIGRGLATGRMSSAAFAVGAAATVGTAADSSGTGGAGWVTSRRPVGAVLDGIVGASASPPHATIVTAITENNSTSRNITCLPYSGMRFVNGLIV
jgi:hypothetical protein